MYQVFAVSYIDPGLKFFQVSKNGHFSECDIIRRGWGEVYSRILDLPAVRRIRHDFLHIFFIFPAYFFHFFHISSIFLHVSFRGKKGEGGILVDPEFTTCASHKTWFSSYFFKISSYFLKTSSYFFKIFSHWMLRHQEGGDGRVYSRILDLLFVRGIRHDPCQYVALKPRRMKDWAK